jgi:hypothetical protein
MKIRVLQKPNSNYSKMNQISASKETSRFSITIYPENNLNATWCNKRFLGQLSHFPKPLGILI